MTTTRLGKGEEMKLKEIKEALNKLTDEQLEQKVYCISGDHFGWDTLSKCVISDTNLYYGEDYGHLIDDKICKEDGIDTSELELFVKKGGLYFEI